MPNPQRSLYLYPLVIPVIVLCSLLCLSGCGRKKESSSQPVTHGEPAAVVKENESFWTNPFRRGTRVARTITASGSSAATQLGISGITLLALTAAAKFLSSSWKIAGATFGFGILATACGVLLSRYPVVVLLIPVTVIVVLLGYGLKVVLGWWMGYNAWKAAATAIEQADTSHYSVGQRAKDIFKDAGIAPILDKALKPLEKQWKQNNL